MVAAGRPRGTSQRARGAAKIAGRPAWNPRPLVDGGLRLREARIEFVRHAADIALGLRDVILASRPQPSIRPEAIDLREAESAVSISRSDETARTA